MYQTARIDDTTDSRSALLVCITRFAMRPAKSFWKNGQLCRTTCQWLCQRMRLVTPGTTALLRTRLSASSVSGRNTSTSAAMPISMGVAAWKAAARSLASISVTSLPMNTGISVSTSATPSPVTNIAREEPPRLPDEVPVEREESGGRGRRGQRGRTDA